VPLQESRLNVLLDITALREAFPTILGTRPAHLVTTVLLGVLRQLNVLTAPTKMNLYRKNAKTVEQDMSAMAMFMYLAQSGSIVPLVAALVFGVLLAHTVIMLILLLVAVA
jgi:hypothetical protein